MTVTVDVVDDTGSMAGTKTVNELVQTVLELERFAGEVSVAFVEEETIADLNARYREAEGPTDVLSFSYSDEAAGEIVVCPRVVSRYAAEDGRPFTTQLGWTLIHGALHLADYDHETDQGEMREREQFLLTELAGLVSSLAPASEPR
jgi:probable rRNA maturation factor